MPDTEIARKFQEAVKKKKAENNPDYKGDNPETSEEVINDLNKMGNVKKSESGKTHDLGVFGVYEQPEEKVKELKPQEQTEEDLIKAALGEDVFERPDKELEKPKPCYGNAFDEQIASMTLRLKGLENPSELFNKKATLKQKEERQKLIETLKHGIEEAKLRKEGINKKNKDKKPEKTEIKSKQPGKKEKHYIYKEVGRLGENIGLAKKEFRRAKTDEEKKKAEARIEYFIAELEKAKESWNRIKDLRSGEKKEIKIRPQVEIDAAESQSGTYGEGILANKSTPEDLKEFINKEKEIKRGQKTQKENVPDLTTSKEELAIASERFGFDELKVKIKIMLSQFQKVVREFEEKRIDSKEELIEKAGEIDRATLISLIENNKDYLGKFDYNAYNDSFIDINTHFSRVIDNKLAELSKKSEIVQKEFKEEPKEELEWIMGLSKDIETQEKIKVLFGRILEMARKVDAYQGLSEESLRKIAENKVKSGF